MSRTFTAASTVDEALAALAAGARPVAGGTDLVVGARQGKAKLPDAIVGIDRIEALRLLEASEGGLRLGALVTHEAIVLDADVREGIRRSPTRRRSSARTRPGRRGRSAGT